MAQKWYRSLTVWVAIVAQILTLLVMMNIINLEQSEVIKTLALAIGELLVLVGILNNPTRNNIVALRATVKGAQGGGKG